MNIVILGAGAVGGYFGGRLALSGSRVTFLVREHRYQQLKDGGLKVKSPYGDFSVIPKLALSAEEIANPDVVIVALKNYHLHGALPELRSLVKKGAKLLPLLNGVQHMDELIQEFGEDNVWGGLCYIETTLDAQGNVIHTSQMQDIVFGSPSTSSENGSELLLKELESALTESGVNVRVSHSIMVDMWQKFIFLASFSGITASTRQPIGKIVGDAQTREFLEDMIHEIISVAEARQVNLPVDTFTQMMGRVTGAAPTMTSSLHRDLEKGLPLEIDSLQGAILDMAKPLSIATPCTRAVYALLHPYKEGAK